MKTVYDGKVESSLQRLDELDLNTDIWQSYFRNRIDFGASFVIPVIGAESCGKSTTSLIFPTSMLNKIKASIGMYTSN